MATEFLLLSSLNSPSADVFKTRDLEGKAEEIFADGHIHAEPGRERFRDVHVRPDPESTGGPDYAGTRVHVQDMHGAEWVCTWNNERRDAKMF